MARCVVGERKKGPAPSPAVGWVEFGYRHGLTWIHVPRTIHAPATFMTVAHEIGHNFGAYHTLQTGGIMSYDALVRKEYRFTGANPTEVRRLGGTGRWWWLF